MLERKRSNSANTKSIGELFACLEFSAVVDVAKIVCLVIFEELIAWIIHNHIHFAVNFVDDKSDCTFREWLKAKMKRKR